MNDGSIRVVILAAAGKGFCAGHDLKEIRALNEQPKIEELFDQCSRDDADHYGAAAAGYRAGAGRRSRRRLPARRAVRPRGRLRGGEVRHARRDLGLLLLDPGRRHRPQPVLRKHAMEMLLTGDTMDAHQALDWGLVNRVVPAEARRGDRHAGKAARREAAGAARGGKRAFYAQMDLGVAQAYELASGVIASSFAHQEGREGMDAFIEKRDPPGRSRQQP